MIKKLLVVTILVAFFIFPQTVWGNEVEYTKSCLMDGEREIVFTSPQRDIDMDVFPDSGIAQVYPSVREVNGKYQHRIAVDYMATAGEIREYYKTISWIKEKTENMDELEKIRFVNGFFQKNTEYGGGSTAVDAVVRGKAICEGYAIGFHMIAKEIGLNSRVVWGEAGGEIHTWNEVKVNGETYGVDTCWNEILKNPESWEKHKKCGEYDL